MVIELPYRSPNFSKESIRKAIIRPRFFRGHVRTALGKLYTNKEFNKRSDDVLKRKMP